MKAITLYEPWASLMAIGAKANETRPMRTNYRGDICIHAAKSAPDFSQELSDKAVHAFVSRDMKPDPRTLGCIIAVVDLWDVQSSEQFSIRSMDAQQIIMSVEEYDFGNYTKGRWIYRTRNVRRLKTPIPCKGFQCVGWTVPANVEAEVLKQLSEF